MTSFVWLGRRLGLWVLPHESVIGGFLALEDLALAANSLTGFVLEQGKDQGGSLPQSALINKTWQLDALASKRFEALKRNTFKIDKLLAGLIFMEYLLEHSGHDQVEVTRVELPTGLIVEYYQDRIADPVPPPCEG